VFGTYFDLILISFVHFKCFEKHVRPVFSIAWFFEVLSNMHHFAFKNVVALSKLLTK